jgi:hypothetical protein
MVTSMKMAFSELQHHAVWQILTNVSGKLNASIIRCLDDNGNTLYLTHSNIFKFAFIGTTATAAANTTIIFTSTTTYYCCCWCSMAHFISV